MNPTGVGSLLRSKVKLGVDASAAAGPKGRATGAATDAYMSAEILTYSRAKGLFAGVSLEGSTLRPDNGANKKLYNRKITASVIVLEHRPFQWKAKSSSSFFNASRPPTGRTDSGYFKTFDFSKLSSFGMGRSEISIVSPIVIIIKS